MYNRAGIAVLAAAIAAGACNSAAAFSLDFTGVASPGATGNVFSYEGYPIPSVSFAGQPVNLSLDVAGSPEGLYVQDFSVSWSGQTYDYPYQTATGGEGYPADPFYDFAFGFMSAVTFSPSGGSITIFPTFGWEAYTDGSFYLTLSYTLSSPHPVGSVFTDSNVMGAGNVQFGVEDDVDPMIGPYDADSEVPFSLSSVSSAPEPAAWALMLVGLGMIGATCRARRNTPAERRSRQARLGA